MQSDKVLPSDLMNSRRNNPSIRASSPLVSKKIEPLLDFYEAYRADQGARVLSEADRKLYKLSIEILFLDLLAVYSGDPKKYIGYSRGKNAFVRGGVYWDHEKDRPLLSYSAYLNAIDFFAEKGWLENYLQKTGYQAYSSRMRPTELLIGNFTANDFNWTSISYDPDAPCIIVKDENKRPVPHPVATNFDIEKATDNLRRINRNLQSTRVNLNISDDDYWSILTRLKGDSTQESTGEGDTFAEPFEFSNRSLRRIFALGSFDHGGRFYGGWWQAVPSEYRKFIEIDGAITVEMDFSGMQPSLMYGLARAERPEEPYVPNGWPQEARSDGKRAFLQLVNSKPAMADPKRWEVFAPASKPDILPEDWSEITKWKQDEIRRDAFLRRFGRPYTDFLTDIFYLHRPIQDRFFRASWGTMQRLDSDIAESVMVSLLDADVPITALPIHDHSLSEEAQRVHFTKR